MTFLVEERSFDFPRANMAAADASVVVERVARLGPSLGRRRQSGSRAMRRETKRGPAVDTRTARQALAVSGSGSGSSHQAKASDSQEAKRPGCKSRRKITSSGIYAPTSFMEGRRRRPGKRLLTCSGVSSTETLPLWDWGTQQKQSATLGHGTRGRTEGTR